MPSPPEEPSRAPSRTEESGKPRPEAQKSTHGPGLHPSLGGEIRILQTRESAARPDLPRPRPSLLPQSLQGLLPVLTWGPEPLQHGLRDPSHQNPGDPRSSCPLAKLQPAQAPEALGLPLIFYLLDLVPSASEALAMLTHAQPSPFRPWLTRHLLGHGTAPPSDLGPLLHCPRTPGANTIPRRQPRSSACPTRPGKPRA